MDSGIGRRPTALVGAFVAGVATTALVSRRHRRSEEHSASAALPEIPDPTAEDELPEPSTQETARPDPDAAVKPDSPSDLTRPSVGYVLRQTVSEFTHDQCTDLAAALTYYAVLSLFPALVVVVSLVGVIGQSQRTSQAILDIIGEISPGAAADTLRGPIEQLASAPTAGFALVAGLLGALWSASGFVGAFGRAMNRIYEVDEGRPAWKLRGQQLLLTLTGLIGVAAAALLLAVSGPVAETVGGFLGLGETALTVWNVARWPALLALVTVGVAVLYYFGPNVQQPKFRWISIGAAVAIVVWLVASLLFGVYVANFGSYNKTFGTLAGVAVFLLWLWITNLAMLFGAEIDAELERGRQLQAGIAAEDELQLPLRDTSAIDKNNARERRGLLRGRRLRRTRGRQA